MSKLRPCANMVHWTWIGPAWKKDNNIYIKFFCLCPLFFLVFPRMLLTPICWTTNSWICFESLVMKQETSQFLHVRTYTQRGFELSVKNKLYKIFYLNNIKILLDLKKLFLKCKYRICLTKKKKTSSHLIKQTNSI